MAEYSLYGKRKLCYTDVLDFTDFQGIGNDPLYKRFDSIYSVIQGAIDRQYRSFLSHPLYSNEEDQIIWYVEEWGNPPMRYVDLVGSEKELYESIRSSTIEHYRDALSKLKGEESRILARAIKYIEDDFIYCYDGKIVLSIWGMTIDDKKHKILGSIVHEFDYEKRYRITFDCGTKGFLKSKTGKVVDRAEGFILSGMDLPTVIPNEGYTFERWEPNPLGYEVNNDIVFKAEYSEASQIPSTKSYTVRFINDGNSILEGDTLLAVCAGHILTDNELPSVTPSFDYTFDRWAPDISAPIIADTTFIAKSSKKKQSCQIKFSAGDFGVIHGNSSITKQDGLAIEQRDIPRVNPNSGYEFIGWDTSPINFIPTGDKVFTAQYEKEDDPDKTTIIAPEKTLWHKRLFAFFPFVGSGCLKWLLYLLLLLLFLWLFSNISRSCSDHNGNEIVPVDTLTTTDGRVIDDNGKSHNIVDDKGNFIDKDGNVIDLGDDHYVNPIVSPIIGDNGVYPPIIENPGMPGIIANRLNIYFENEDADLIHFARDFKEAYPDDGYIIIGLDNNVKMLQIQIPENERNRVREEINAKIPDHDFFVVDESVFELTGATSIEGKDAGWHLLAINLKQGWSITKGESDIIVAIVDDGLDSKHEMFKGRIVNPYNVFSQNNKLSQGEGHGTHVAGLAVGSDANYSKGASGMAPLCKLMPIQVFDNKLCTFSTITSGIMYAIHKEADVVNVSIGPSFKGLSILPIAVQEEIARTRFKNEEKVWRKIISIANKKNAILVFAVGNDKVLASMPPENRTNNSVNVAAVGMSFSVTDFSNFGSGSNISAPGQDIYSSVPVNSFAFFDGTSMAAPIVTGTIALMKSIKRDINVSQVIGVLQATGRQVRGNVPPMVQIDKALLAVKNGNILDDAVSKPIADKKTDNSEIMPAPESPVNNSDDYSAIRRMIEEYKRKIAELEKQLPENRK